MHFKAFLPEQTWLAWHPARRRKKYEGHQHNLPLPGCCCLVDGGSPSSFLPEKPISHSLFLLLLPLGEDSREGGRRACKSKWQQRCKAQRSHLSVYGFAFPRRLRLSHPRREEGQCYGKVGFWTDVRSENLNGQMSFSPYVSTQFNFPYCLGSCKKNRRLSLLFLVFMAK